jgi:hypothetical protein
VQIELLNFPVDRFERARQHTAAVQRELDVLRVDEARALGMPARLDELVASLSARFAGFGLTRDQLDELVERGERHADLIIPVQGAPAERVAALGELRALLGEIDTYCESGDQLLTVVTPPDPFGRYAIGSSTS